MGMGMGCNVLMPTGIYGHVQKTSLFSEVRWCW